MTIQSRSYTKDEDFPLIMNFLANLWERTKSYENGFPIRFENNMNTLEDGVRIWEEIPEETSHSEKKIVGLTSRESFKDCFLHIDPDYRLLEREIVEWIEDHFRRNIKGLGEKCIVDWKGFSGSFAAK